HVSVQVSHRAGGRFEPLNALVDTGATYSWIPRDVLEGLGIVPEDQWPFVLADGREVLYPVAWINIRMRDRVQPTIVVFGEPGSDRKSTRLNSSHVSISYAVFCLKKKKKKKKKSNKQKEQKKKYCKTPIMSTTDQLYT